MLSPANSPSLPFKNGATPLLESLHQRNPLYTLLTPQSIRLEHIKSDKSEQHISAIDQGRRFSIQSEGVSESDCKSAKGSKPNKISVSDIRFAKEGLNKGLLLSTTIMIICTIHESTLPSESPKPNSGKSETADPLWFQCLCDHPPQRNHQNTNHLSFLRNYMSCYTAWN
jgi:hypothetical protein